MVNKSFLFHPWQEEVEMEDVAEEEEDDSVEDIDSCDKKNPLAVVEYIDDLYTFYRKSEVSSSVAPNYMAQQVDINERMRGILIDWLIEVKCNVLFAYFDEFSLEGQTFDLFG